MRRNSIITRLLIVTLSFVFLNNGTNAAKEDEGMWLPILLSPKNYNDMVAHGLKLSPDQLYNINNASIKDAIVWFGAGCTGEVVSPEGLLITNHHCGYDAIATASSTTNNYLRDGFWASNHNSEIPAKGLSVQFLIRMEDVTAKVMEKLKEVPFEQWQSALPAITKPLADEACKGTHYEAFVREMFKSNQFYLFVMEKFTDIRLVGTPPESIGKFGGDVDNWMWPRHTGDFSMFRIYAGKDNKPAAYSQDNVPYKPKKYLPVSLKGIKEGDYAMIFGFPGRTNRYETSYGVKLAVEESNPSIVKLREKRLAIMKREMDRHDSIRLKQASRYAQIANYWKYFIGQTEQLNKNKVFERKQNEEQQFINWAASKPEYADIFIKLKNAYDAYKPYNKIVYYMREGINGSPLLYFAASFAELRNALQKTEVDSTAIKQAIKVIKIRSNIFNNIFHPVIDENITSAMLLMFYNDIDISQHPEIMKKILKSKGKSIEEKMANYTKNMYKKTKLVSEENLNKLLIELNLKQILGDPAIETALSFLDNYNQKYKKQVDDFNLIVAREGRLYVKGLMEMQPDKMFYPDANSTMRCTYGNVKAYSPRDAVFYKYYTTLSGVIQKEIPGDEEFTVPEKLKALFAKKDFGIYADYTGDIPVAFITNNDITGGNSGSPVIDAEGRLIGTAFDGNWEAMSGDIAFDKDLKRTICVDIRYVLFIIDKLGGAPHLVREMTLIK